MKTIGFFPVIVSIQWGIYLLLLLFYCLLEENTAWNPKFNFDHFDLVNMNINLNSECKANYIFKTLSARVTLDSAATWKILPFSGTKRNHKDVHGKGISKNKEKLISHLNLNLVVLLNWNVLLSAAHLFSVFTTDKRKYFFRSTKLDSWLSSKLKKIQKYF